MTISRKVFDKKGFVKRRYEMEEHPVILLLKNNSHLAFTAKEIERKTNMKPATVRSVINVLNKKNKLEHKSPYFAWKIVKKKAPARKIKKKK